MSKVDLAVIGAGLGGLAAAARLARVKKNPLVFVHGTEAGGACIPCKADGYLFAAGPVLSYGFERSGTLQQLYADLGMSHHAVPVSPSYQVALPDRRITVFAEQGETLEEIRREFPREIDKAAQFYRDVRRKAERAAKNRLSSYIAKHRRSGAFLQHYRFSRELITFFDIQSRYFFQQPIAELPLSSLITLTDSSPLHLPRGFKQVADQLLDFILKNNGKVLFSEPFPELVYRRGRVVELITSSGTVKTEMVVLNTKGSGRVVTICIAISDQLVPVGMIQEVICLSDYARPQDLFGLSLSDHEDELSAPHGMRALTVRFHAQDIPQETGSLLEPVGKIMPFAEDFIYAVYNDSSAEKQYPMPDSLRVSKKDISRAGEQGTIKNMYSINDEDGYPELAIAEARRIVNRLIS